MEPAVMEPLNLSIVDTAWGERRFELLNSDIANLGFAVDLLMVSTLGSDYSPLPGTVVGALSSKGISVEDLRADPDLDLLLPAGRLWVSKDIDPNGIGRIMCVEIPSGGIRVDQIVLQAFRSLPMLEARGFNLNSICLPILGTGSAGLEVEVLLRPILDGAQWALRVLKSAKRICLVEINPESASKMRDAMDDVLERVRITVTKGPLADAIRAEIRVQIEKLGVGDEKAYKLVVQLHRAISEDAPDRDIGWAARYLRDYVISQIEVSESAKDFAGNRWKAIKSKGIPDWVNAYIQVLSIFGNESAHNKANAAIPWEIHSNDLVACLFAIQRVLDFWLTWRSPTERISD